MAQREILKTDVLCVGAGIAGLMAAIRAAEQGARVIVADKANPLYSGSGAMGCDHFKCYIPEVHGPNIKPMIDSSLRSFTGKMRDREFTTTWLEKSFDIVKLWDTWGIPMTYRGRYEFAGHGFPGRPLTALKYSGQKQKAVLLKEARARGVEILSRVMVLDLLKADGVQGAIGISTREDKLFEFHAKSVVLGTGLTTRLYPSPTPGWMFNLAYSPTNTGDGRAMAYRAGAELTNVEMTMRWAGPKFFSRCGKGTWVGVFRDPQGKPIGPFVSKPDRKYGDSAADVWETVFEDYARSGRGPVYMDCRGMTDEDYEYMMHWMKHEGNTALVTHMAEEGINVRHHPVEFMTYELTFAGGVYYNAKGETSLKGLYAAGDEFFGAISCAATFGWIAGENAAKHARESELPAPGKWDDQIARWQKLAFEVQTRQDGARWQEANIALQQIMVDYAGSIRSETLLNAGLNHLRRVKAKLPKVLMARDEHELIRALETLNLIELGELIFITANERKETRDKHVRADYPFTNPLLDKYLMIKKVEDKPVMEWREIRR